MNTLISYPRTGTHWTRRRIEVLARWADPSRKLRARYEHGPFHPKHYDYASVEWELPEGDVFALIREAKLVVVSNWHWIEMRGEGEAYKGHLEYKSLEAYVPYGALRYASYLNWLMTLDLESFYFAEWTASEMFVREEIPRILGVDYVPCEEAVAATLEAGKLRVNLVGADHDAVPEELLLQIDDTIESECRFQPYLDRYCS